MTPVLGLLTPVLALLTPVLGHPTPVLCLYARCLDCGRQLRQFCLSITLFRVEGILCCRGNSQPGVRDVYHKVMNRVQRRVLLITDCRE